MNIRPCTLASANAFVKAYHRHNKPVVGCLWATAAVQDDRVVGVAIVGRPVARRLDDGMTVEVVRLCVLPEGPRNACSFLYAACRRQAQALGYAKCITYTLQRESGASLRGAGWLPFVLEPHGQWDCPSRPRDKQDIYEEPKVRWEVTP